MLIFIDYRDAELFKEMGLRFRDVVRSRAPLRAENAVVETPILPCEILTLLVESPGKHYSLASE